MKNLIQYFVVAIVLCMLNQNCMPAKVVNVKSHFDSKKKKLELTMDLIGNDKYKYDLDIRLTNDTFDYKILQNEISPKSINIIPANDLSFQIYTKSSIFNENFFLVKLTPKRRKRDLNEIEIAAIQSDTNKTIPDQLINPNIIQSAFNKTFINIGSNFLSNYPTINYNNVLLGFGHIYNKIGYYVEVGSTLNSPTNTPIKNSFQKVISVHPNTTYYSFTQNKKIERLTISSGALIRVAPSVIGIIGVGYGRRNEFWEVEELINSGSGYRRSIKYSQYVSSSFNGPQLQIGSIIDFNKTHIKFVVNVLPQTGKYLSPAPLIDGGISFGLNF